MRITTEAQQLIDKGFNGNGCGSGLVSKVLCKIVCKTLLIDPDKLKIVWKIHDAEFSLSRTVKSMERQSVANNNLYLNLMDILGDQSGWRYSVAKMLHTALVWGSDGAYWDNQKNGVSYKGLIVAILAYHFVIKNILTSLGV
jgi:hypothetical protein